MNVEKFRGFVKWFDEKKGYGFISVDDATRCKLNLSFNREVFVHGKNVHISLRPLNTDDVVEFYTRQGKEGPEAIQLTVISRAAQTLAHHD
jgi:cold shock CspA family protein